MSGCRAGEFIRDRYQLLEVLGKESQGPALKARDHQHDRLVAIAVHPAPSEQDRRALLSGVRLLLSVQPHPGLPLVREDFFESDRYFIVMDWVEGRDLAHVVAEEGELGLPFTRALRYVEQAASALDHLHRHDPPVVHMEVEPANLILTSGDRVLLTGFGLARRAPEFHSRSATHGYAAPEVAGGHPPTPASDVYSLAATAFTLLTGRAPDGLPASWEGVPADRVAAVQDALRGGMATHPGSRPSAGELSERLGSRPEGRARPGDTLSRRLAALWVADIDGSDRSRVQVLQEVAADQVAANGGTLVRVSPEGSLLAHAPSVAAAIDAALGLRERFEECLSDRNGQTHLRIGVHLGDIVFAADGLHGHGVDVALRLLDEAAPGGIVVSEDVWRQCRRRPELQLVPLGRRELEDLDEPIGIWEVAPHDGAQMLGELTTRPSRETRKTALAVLPFEVLGQGQRAEVLAAGLHDDLLARLSKLSAMTVISRHSVMGYRDSGKPTSLIARELSVGTVVTGTTQAVGDRVRLTVQLIDAPADTQVWAETYDRELTAEDLFSIQTELAQRIVDSLRTELSPGEEQKLSIPPPTDDLDAYRLAVEGRMQLDLKSAESLPQAIELFEHALAIDPGYVAAWAGLTDALMDMHAYVQGDEELLRQGEQALQRALELDPDSAEARASLGQFLGHVRSDGPGAIREYSRAIELNPGYADAHSWYAWESYLLGRGEEALEHALRAVELNPRSAEAVGNAALSYVATGHPDRGLVEARRMQELSADFSSGYLLEGVALYELGRYSDAVAALSRELTDPWAGSGPDVALALAHAADGTSGQAERILRRIDPDADPFAAGAILAALDDTETALEIFGAIDELGYWAVLAIHILWARVWEPMRNDPRFRRLVATAYRSRGAEPPHDL